ncbi:hypothetical protein HK098_004585 [Nowakowskiella sp. JEL0407]|nr:hypothetical protein HK098_004585 [Nowakowskiella sp. JEL0407]
MPAHVIPHPLEDMYDPVVLCKFPEAPEGDGNETTFPPYLPIFCFPNSVRLKHEESGHAPPETFHSFIVTEGTGEKIYGVCITFYTPLSPQHTTELSQKFTTWKMVALASTYLEYIEEVQKKLKGAVESLVDAKCELSRLCEEKLRFVGCDVDGEDGENRASVDAIPPSKQVSESFDEYADSCEITSTSDKHSQHLQISVHIPKDPDFPLESPTLQLHIDPISEASQLVSDLEEKIQLYKDLLSPIKNTVLADPEKVYQPRCIGVLSRWPWHDLLKDWLCEVLRLVRGDFYEEMERNGRLVLPLERYITNLLYEVPLPPPGKLEISISIGNLRLFCSRPPVNSISTIQNFSLYPILRTLSPQTLTTLLELSLSERKIIFLSSHLSMLTLASETLCLLMFPLVWQHIMIPVLPVRLLSYLQAPMPYIVGVAREYFDGVEEFKPSDAAVIDLDNDKIHLTDPPPQLPPHLRKKLISRISKHSVSNQQYITSSFTNLTVTPKSKCRGVPITSQFLCPFGKSAPRCCVSALSGSRVDEEGGKEGKVEAGKLSFGSEEGDRVFDNLGENMFPKSGSEKFTDSGLTRRISNISNFAKSFSKSKQPSAQKVLKPSSSSTSISSIFSSFSTSSLSHRILTSPSKRTPSSLFSEESSTSSPHRPSITTHQKSPTLSHQKEKYIRNPSASTISETATEVSTDWKLPLFNKLPTVQPVQQGGNVKRLEGHALVECSVDCLRENFGLDTSVVTPTAVYLKDLDPVQCREREDEKEKSAVRCRLCMEPFREKECGLYLQCSACKMCIHTECIPLLEGTPCPIIFNEKKIQKAFLKIFTSLFKNYREFLVLSKNTTSGGGKLARQGSRRLQRPMQSATSLFSPSKEHTGNGEGGGVEEIEENWFRKEDFLNSVDKEVRPYLTHLIETQAFAQFTLDRALRHSGLTSTTQLDKSHMTSADYDILFFDESIKAKLNRSKLRFSKDSTPFLKDTSYDVGLTVECLKPNSDGIEIGENFGTGSFPIEIDESRMLPPRPVASLVSDTDYDMMRSHTYELMSRTRMLASNAKRKQDVTKWMRSMRKNFQRLGNGEVVGLGFLSDEERREMFEERLAQVSSQIDGHDAVFLGTLSIPELEYALENLQKQNLVLMHAADEEQLVDSSDQEELQQIFSRLFRVITIYEDCLQSKKQQVGLEEVVESREILGDGELEEIESRAFLDNNETYGKENATDLNFKKLIDLDSSILPPLPTLESEISEYDHTVNFMVAINANESKMVSNTIPEPPETDPPIAPPRRRTLKPNQRDVSINDAKTLEILNPVTSNWNADVLVEESKN